MGDTLDTPPVMVLALAILATHTHTLLLMVMEIVPMLDLAILVLVILEPEVTMARGMLMPRLTPNTWLPPTPDTLDTLVMALAILVTPTLLPMDMETTLAILVLAMLVLDSAMLLLDSEPGVTMARGMLMLSPKFLLVTPTLVMVLAILVIPTLVPMDMETWLYMAMLDLAMLVLVVLDLAMDIPTLPPLEPAGTILEPLSHAKPELFPTFMIFVCYHLFSIKTPPPLKKKKKKKKK